MTITYRLGDSLYVNMTNRCSNRCDFCIRNYGDGIGGSGDLWLDREPTVDETVQDILKNVSGCKELVFCGYGEPLMRLDDVIAVIKAVKPKIGIPVRINTNGQADLIHGRQTAKELAGLVDTVSISLNAPNAKEYEALCHSDYGEKAFDAILKYAADCKKYIPNVVFSVVDVMDKEDIEKCRKIAEDIGVIFRVREMIK
ncbi:radical SAM protein [[Clostridium] cellulosi]|uniref:Radical SAM protein n=1 Tax=[Clostridium] cellulosi TaxID=29343 RepID=A0A078KLB8_9FIRM|nr:radical SAM protein [[Clostridium] cellulosi]